MIRSIEQFEDIMQGSIVRILGWALTKNNDVRIGWQTTGAPAWDIEKDMVFITAVPQTSPYSREHSIIVENGSPDINISTGFTRVMKLQVICYGKNATENAYKILLGMFKEVPRQELVKEKIFFLPDADAPKRVPELFEGQWWERSDLELFFNELIVDDQQMNAVESVDVEVHDVNGLLTEITIN